MADEDTVTMSNSEAVALRNAYSMLNKLYNHPDKAMEFKKLAKDAGYKVPELDTIERVTKPYDEKLTGLEKSLKDLEDKYSKRDKDAQDEKELRDMQSSLEAIKKSEGFDDEGMQKVIKRMQEKKNPDVEAAAAWVKNQMPKPKVTTTSNNFASSKFKTSSLTGGGEDGEAGYKKLMSGQGDDFFADVANDIFNNPEDPENMQQRRVHG